MRLHFRTKIFSTLPWKVSWKSPSDDCWMKNFFPFKVWFQDWVELKSVTRHGSDKLTSAYKSDLASHSFIKRYKRKFKKSFNITRVKAGINYELWRYGRFLKHCSIRIQTRTVRQSDSPKLQTRKNQRENKKQNFEIFPKSIPLLNCNNNTPTWNKDTAI